MKQECFAFIYAFQKWQNYLNGVNFTWETDHKALTQLNQKAQVNKRCERWRLKIQEFDFKVKHIPGTSNAMPDYLSRSPVDEAEEDADDVIALSLKSTQTDFHDINDERLITAFVQTRSMKRKNETTTDPSPMNRTITSTDSRPKTSEENRITPFTLEQLRDAQKDDQQINEIRKNIDQNKKYIIIDDVLMLPSKPPISFVPKGNFRISTMKIYHDSLANGSVRLELSSFENVYF